MAIPAACRVCLVDNIKLDTVKNADLIDIYEKLTKTKFNEVGYPKFMCYLCLSVLQKCQKFMETAQDANNVLDQWYNNNADIRLAKPIGAYLVSKVAVISIHNENVYSENVISMEEVDLDQDSINSESILDLEKTDTEQQMDNINSLNVDNSENNQGNDSPINNENTDARSGLISRKVLVDNETINETQLFTKNVMTVVKIEELDENETEIHVAKNTHKKRAVLKPKNKQTSKTRSNTTHEIKHENDMYICNDCQYKTTKKCIIIRHLKKHTGEKPFSCSLCEYKCAEKCNLKTHMRIHTGEKPFSCPYCGYRCGASFNLKMHIRTHTNEKPFSCTFCDYKCAEKSNLKTHLRKHTDEKPFSCELCSFRCITKSNLKIHMRKHGDDVKPFACEYCDFTAVYKSNLTEHLRIHTGEKPFKCKVCGRKFKRRTHLRDHTAKLHPYHVERKGK